MELKAIPPNPDPTPPARPDAWRRLLRWLKREASSVLRAGRRALFCPNNFGSGAYGGYVLLLGAGLCCIACRRESASLTALNPSFAAAWIMITQPARLAYVAAAPLPANHQLRADDLLSPPGLDTDLYQYLPDKKPIVGQYLQAEVQAGQPILPGMLGSPQRIVPETCLIAVKLNSQPGRGQVRPNTVVTLKFDGVSEMLKGQILYTSQDAAPNASAEASPPSQESPKK